MHALMSVPIVSEIYLVPAESRYRPKLLTFLRPIFFPLLFACSIFSAFFAHFLLTTTLGDNGSEFSNPSAIELDLQGNQRTRIFYCDPQAPYQKGAAENNHSLIRRIIPKGTSLDCFTQGY